MKPFQKRGGGSDLPVSDTQLPLTSSFPVDELVQKLDCAHPALRVMHRSELPERWHYQHSHRIEPIIATVDQGYGLSVERSDFCIRGMHGYDNDLVDMRVRVGRGGVGGGGGWGS